LNRRWLGPLLSAFLILGVGAALVVSIRNSPIFNPKIPVSGLIGSEKEEFFRDERVQRALDRLGIEVRYEKVGSREISEKLRNETYDFGFPAGVPAAEKIRQDWQLSSQGEDVFFTPMTVATWQPIADLLAANGVARLVEGHYYLEMARFLELVKEGKRWNELENNQVFDANRSILINSTDIKRSNSAAMYLALASYVANGAAVVQNRTQADALLPLVTELFVKQGLTGYSSEEPFEDYLVMGMGKAPLVMIYESQFLAEAARTDGSIRPEMVLMYPDPAIYTKHVLVPLTENGKRLGEALTADEELRRLAVEYGFRNTEGAYFQEFFNSQDVPADLLNVADTPTFELLEYMIQSIQNSMQ